MKHGNWLSNTIGFARVFAQDFKNLSPATKDQLKLSNEHKDLELARDEVFADLYAHSLGTESNHIYSKLMKQHFPTVLKFFEEFNRK